MRLKIMQYTTRVLVGDKKTGRRENTSWKGVEIKVEVESIDLQYAIY